MIEIQDIWKYYGRKGRKKAVIGGLSAVFESGRNVAVMGRNGAGKSTLLRIIGGSLRPDFGDVVRHGKVSWPLGFAGGFHGALTGLQNTRFVGRVYGADTDALVDFVRDFAELGDFLDMPFQTYSSGMRARLAFGASGMRARLAFGVSMGIKFDWYLVDEITAVGDAPFRRKCDEVFSTRLKNSQMVMVSHSNDQLKKYCDCALVLNEGTAVFYDEIDEGIKAYTGIVGT